MEDLLSILQKELKNNKGAHGIDHLIRVRNIAKKIGKEEEANLKILEAMALLHDVVRPEGKEDEYHTVYSASKAKEILSSLNFSDKEINTIVKGILSHSIHSNHFEEPDSIEAKILFDSDKIEAVGQIGVSRWFMTIASKNVSLEEAALIYLKTVHKLKKSKRNLYTRLGNKLIKERLAFSTDFMQNLLKQLKEF